MEGFIEGARSAERAQGSRRDRRGLREVGLGWSPVSGAPRGALGCGSCLTPALVPVWARVWPSAVLRARPLPVVCTGVTFWARKLPPSQGHFSGKGSCVSSAAGGGRPDIWPGHEVAPRGFGRSPFALIQGPPSQCQDDPADPWHARPVHTSSWVIPAQAARGPGSPSRTSRILELCHENNPWRPGFCLTLALQPSWRSCCAHARLLGWRAEACVNKAEDTQTDGFQSVPQARTAVEFSVPPRPARCGHAPH